MGTRNLVCVVLDGKYRVAQYGQWDGYPTGQGKTIVKFLRGLDAAGLATFKDKVRQVVELTDEAVEARRKEAGADGSGFVDMDTAEAFKKKSAHLSRDCGAEILKYVLDTEKPEVKLSLEFAADSLFCEWAYVVDLDNNKLEVYRGFNDSERLTPADRFYFLQAEADKKSAEYKQRARSNYPTTYHPVKLVESFDFASLKADTMNKLEDRLNEEDEMKAAAEEAAGEEA